MGNVSGVVDFTQVWLMSRRADMPLPQSRQAPLTFLAEALFGNFYRDLNLNPHVLATGFLWRCQDGIQFTCLYRSLSGGCCHTPPRSECRGQGSYPQGGFILINSFNSLRIKSGGLSSSGVFTLGVLPRKISYRKYIKGGGRKGRGSGAWS